MYIAAIVQDQTDHILFKPWMWTTDVTNILIWPNMATFARRWLLRSNKCDIYEDIVVGAMETNGSMQAAALEPEVFYDNLIGGSLRKILYFICWVK
jgi:hypothetical protein